MGKISYRNKGLNKWAREFTKNERLILGTCYETRNYIVGKQESRVVPIIEPGPVRRVFGEFPRGISRPLSLHYYVFPDYSLCKEEIQRSVIRPDDHPCFHGEPGDYQIETYFLCLSDERGRRIPESMWTEDEIKQALET